MDELQRDFVAAASEFRDYSLEVLTEATTWPMPAPFHQHLQTVRDDHTINIASAHAILPQLLHKLSLLPIEYKQELAASDDWLESARLVLETDRMVTTLNFPASVENRLRESRPAYEEGLQQVASWKVRRKEALDGYWQETLGVMERFKQVPAPAVDDRIAIVTQARDNFSEGLEVREAELSVLRQSVHGRLRPVLENNHDPGMREIKDLEWKITDHHFVLLHSVFNPNTPLDFQAAWTFSRLDILRDILKAPKKIVINSAAPPPANDKESTLVHDQLSANGCPIFLVEYEDPTCLKCDHIFSFNDIVPWVDEHRDCPMCRGSAEFDDLQRLDVERAKGQPACEAVEVEEADEDATEG